MKTSSATRFRYPYEEFSDQIQAMKMVCKWEYTTRFGHVGNAQTSRAHSARVIDHFSDSYENQSEAVQKAELFVSIYDFIGRNAKLFLSQDLMEGLDEHLFAVDPALLRAVHHVFIVADQPSGIDPKRVLALARAFEGITDR